MKIGIYGYGNLGRGVELAVRQSPDATLVGVFTRRDPAAVKTLGAPVFAADKAEQFADKIDVMILCGGSATDLPKITPALASKFNVVDSFDTHASIPTHFEAVDREAVRGGKVALISAGWDPGLFSVNRLYAQAVLPQGQDYTFWGRGVSQGHSDAIRRIEGVEDARQYTVPVEAAMQAAASGEQPQLTTREKHTRECYVVAKPDADRARIEREIKQMPHYFADYDTTVTFITAEEMARDHSGLPHGGAVIRTAVTGEREEHRQCIRYTLELDSNPEFTANVLVAYARAVCRMHGRGFVGCKTVLDVAPADLSPLSPEQLRAHIL